MQQNCISPLHQQQATISKWIISFLPDRGDRSLQHLCFYLLCVSVALQPSSSMCLCNTQPGTLYMLFMLIFFYFRVSVNLSNSIIKMECKIVKVKFMPCFVKVISVLAFIQLFLALVFVGQYFWVCVASVSTFDVSWWMLQWRTMSTCVVFLASWHGIRHDIVNHAVHIAFFVVKPFYLQSVLVHSANCIKNIG
jgi:hypothetical protein